MSENLNLGYITEQSGLRKHAIKLFTQHNYTAWIISLNVAWRRVTIFVAFNYINYKPMEIKLVL